MYSYIIHIAVAMACCFKVGAQDTFVYHNSRVINFERREIWILQVYYTSSAILSKVKCKLSGKEESWIFQRDSVAGNLNVVAICIFDVANFCC